jgi:nucleoid-associated protein YgaU
MSFENSLKKLLKEISLREDFFSACLGGLVVFAVSLAVLNYFSKESERKKITEQAASTINVASANEILNNFPRKYVVKEGEYLAKIAKEVYGDEKYWQEIASYNSIAYVDNIEAGREISLPSIGEIKQGEMAVVEVMGEQTNQNENMRTEVDKSEEKNQSGNEYIVTLGDDLWNISVKVYGTGEKWSRIAAENGILNPDILEVGQKLNIPR